MTKTTTSTDCTTCENARNNFTPGGWVPCADCRPVEYAAAKAALVCKCTPPCD